MPLKNYRFKRSTGIKFFSNILKDKVLYANINNICYKYLVRECIMEVSETPHLYSTHEESDSRMLSHLNQLINEYSVAIRTCDTDCLIIALGCMWKIESSIKLSLSIY